MDFVPAKTDQFQLEARGIEADTLSPAYGIVSDALATGHEVVEEAVTLGPGSTVAKVDNASLLKLLYGNYEAASCRALRSTGIKLCVFILMSLIPDSDIRVKFLLLIGMALRISFMRRRH